MKRTPLKRHTPLKSKCGFTVTRSTLRKMGKSDTAQLKRDIQALVRQIVILRDGGCILRNKRYCNGLPDTPGVVLQADHLITRSNSATYADTRLIVCVCRSCHWWKSAGDNNRKGEYDRLVKTILPSERVALWERAEEQSWKTSKMAWQIEKLALEKELRGYTRMGTGQPL